MLKTVIHCSCQLGKNIQYPGIDWLDQEKFLRLSRETVNEGLVMISPVKSSAIIDSSTMMCIILVLPWKQLLLLYNFVFPDDRYLTNYQKSIWAGTSVRVGGGPQSACGAYHTSTFSACPSVEPRTCGRRSSNTRAWGLRARSPTGGLDTGLSEFNHGPCMFKSNTYFDQFDLALGIGPVVAEWIKTTDFYTGGPRFES